VSVGSPDGAILASIRSGPGNATHEGFSCIPPTVVLIDVYPVGPCRDPSHIPNVGAAEAAIGQVTVAELGQLVDGPLLAAPDLKGMAEVGQ
jgi:hypothetical protein